MRMQTDKGFTLVELMVAAALTTALFLLVIPLRPRATIHTTRPRTGSPTRQSPKRSS